MDQQNTGRYRPDFSAARTRAAPDRGRETEDVDAWLARNIRACSLQEYRHYREYLDQTPAQDLLPGD
ncbi:MULTISPECIES: hypothetical protein [Castellaniella]|mgnify:CR=1 FL=1|jgi:hypothetical protein|uniref:hypothetical protein n=1 Tax=Castellaniella TaxID=359336 RepID=UPI002D7F13A9|nr:hypothetical protein [Castellaniella sp.]HET8704370.1 hypothetical protein [Castellaniella sp.]